MLNGQSTEGGKVSEIQSLTQRINELGGAVDFWNVVMLWGLALAAVAAVVIGVSTRLVVVRTGQLGDLQGQLIAAKDRQLQADLKEKDRQIAVAGKDAARANERAGKAEENAAKAQENLAGANARAAEADAKAESFRSEIAKANESAEQARAQVASATAEAAKANLELAQIKAPRTLSNASSLVESLKAYKGAEYTFSSVFGDEESILLLRQIDAALSNSGWVRVKPPHAFPAINIYGTDQEFAVAQGMTSGIKVSVNSDIPLTTLQAMPVDKLPAPTGAALALAIALTGSLNPPQEAGIKANVELGNSSIVRIEVGRKP
jgi:multidrug efflux pump subunit AcrA (membrane-fusion protein)